MLQGSFSPRKAEILDSCSLLCKGLWAAVQDVGITSESGQYPSILFSRTAVILMELVLLPLAARSPLASSQSTVCYQQYQVQMDK